VTPGTDRRAAFRLTTTIAVGNLAQASLTIAGAALLFAAAQTGMTPGVRTAIAIVGIVAIYLDTHSIAHWAVGRAVGIGFDGYAIAGTAKAHRYPPVMRQLMAHAPFWVARIRRPVGASSRGRGLMLAAGQLSTTITTFAAAAYAWRRVPGGGVTFLVVLVWLGVTTIFGAVLPEGEYRRALRPR